jgi:radical SAM protein (TIGR01212 family)
MDLSQYVHTLGHALQARHGRRVHKVALNVGFTCPNRDGSKGRGGCTFCNNDSFAPERQPERSISDQIASGAQAVQRITGARKLMAYFQAYTNTYADIDRLRRLYDEALEHPDVIGLSIGTRPDCVPLEVLDLLAGYRERGVDVWLELGLQSAFDETLAKVNRGHGFAEYAETTRQARARGLPVCTHLILGLPGENADHARQTLRQVLEVGTDGLKLHPLHVVKATMLAFQWKRGEYTPLRQADYVEQCIDLIAHTPPEVVFHRLTGTAAAEVLLAPAWCEHKWSVINAITQGLAARGLCQGSALGRPYRQERVYDGIAA